MRKRRGLREMAHLLAEVLEVQQVPDAHLAGGAMAIAGWWIAGSGAARAVEYRGTPRVAQYHRAPPQFLEHFIRDKFFRAWLARF